MRPVELIRQISGKIASDCGLKREKRVGHVALVASTRL